MTSQATEPATPSKIDPCSLSNIDQVLIKHTDLEWDVNFDTHIITGWVKHHAEIQKDGASELILDTRDLTVTSASVNEKPTNFKFDPKPFNALGTALRIALPPGLKSGDKLTIELQYQTSPSATAVQWLKPEQTTDKRYPYLFTQCQAIHARSLIPCMDSPSAKFTYAATVRVPEPLVPLMSAIAEENPQGLAAIEHLPPASCKDSNQASKAYKFVQKQSIPSYLLALAVGELVSKDLSPRVRLWSEPSMVEAGAYEFAETEQFLTAAEAIGGPYVWGRYDMLLLPSTFPFGGMENSNLSFITPTLLAGDRSLANVIAHEISHSWTGNLVTNKTWQSFWLNEGWTMWLERKIQGRLQGEKTFQFSASMGYLDLLNEVNNLGATNPYTALVPDLSGYIKLQKTVQEQFSPTHPFTALCPDLTGGVDPDDAFSSIPYEKGFYFLYYLETLVGGAEPFQAFFRAYLDRFKDHPLTADDFKDFFLEYFRSKGVTAVESIDWDTWYYGLGMPPKTNTYDDSLAQDAFNLATKWHTSDVMGIGSDGPQDASPDDLKGWSSQQIVAFLDKLGELRSMQPMHPKVIRKMNELYKLDDSTNCEIRCSWYLLALKAGDETIVPRVTEFLKEQGRMKYVRPLFRALFNNGKLKEGKQVALGLFTEHAKAYHPICAKMVATDLKLSAEQTNQLLA